MKAENSPGLIRDASLAMGAAFFLQYALTDHRIEEAPESQPEMCYVSMPGETGIAGSGVIYLQKDHNRMVINPYVSEQRYYNPWILDYTGGELRYLVNIAVVL